MSIQVIQSTRKSGRHNRVLVTCTKCQVLVRSLARHNRRHHKDLGGK